jgi:small-conductance mechanosensitive channel
VPLSRASKTLWIVIGLLVTFAVCAPVALAAPQGTEGFQKMVPRQPGQGDESLPATSLIYAAYALVWLVLIGYLFLLWRRAARIEGQVVALHDRLRKKT